MSCQIQYTKVFPPKVIPVSRKIKCLCENHSFFLRGWVIIGKTSIFAYFTHFDGIVSAHWDILKKTLSYENGPVWYYLH